MDQQSQAFIAISIACCAGTALAQSADNYPSKPIRVVVPQPPGGTTDAVARLFAAKMTELLKQQIVIDNRAGSGVASLSSLQVVAGANPDGYTLLAVVPSFVIAPVLAKETRIRAEGLCTRHADVARPVSAVELFGLAGQVGQGIDRARESETRLSQYGIGQYRQRHTHDIDAVPDRRGHPRPGHIRALQRGRVSHSST
jgi:hypothetical protein